MAEGQEADGGQSILPMIADTVVPLFMLRISINAVLSQREFADTNYR